MSRSKYRSTTHVRRLETQHLRCHRSLYRNPLFSIMPESRTARKHPSRSGIGFWMNRSIGNCHASNLFPRYLSLAKVCHDGISRR